MKYVEKALKGLRWVLGPSAATRKCKETRKKGWANVRKGRSHEAKVCTAQQLNQAVAEVNNQITKSEPKGGPCQS